MKEGPEGSLPCARLNIIPAVQKSPDFAWSIFAHVRMKKMMRQGVVEVVDGELQGRLWVFVPIGFASPFKTEPFQGIQGGLPDPFKTGNEWVVRAFKTDFIQHQGSSL